MYSCPTISNNTITGNTADPGGGIKFNNYSSGIITNNIIAENSSGGWGGGIGLVNYSSPTISNNIISGNSTIRGGGICMDWYSSPTIINNTITGNNASDVGGGIAVVTKSSPVIINNIITSNVAPTGGGIHNLSSTPSIDYNDVWNNSPNDYSGCSAGPNDISQDPLFVDPLADDYHLQSGSPCIDDGTNEGAPTEDIEGNPRPIDGDGDGTATTDMGAYEYVPPPPPPPPPPAVGGEVYPINKLNILALWLGLLLILAIGGGIFALRRRRAH